MRVLINSFRRHGSLKLVLFAQEEVSLGRVLVDGFAKPSRSTLGMPPEIRRRSIQVYVKGLSNTHGQPRLLKLCKRKAKRCVKLSNFFAAKIAIEPSVVRKRAAYQGRKLRR